MTATTLPGQPVNFVRRIVGRQDATDGPASFTRTNFAVRIFGGLARLSLGWVFLWAFFDKTFGLGHATASKDAWIQGGSPTYGFLSFGAAGPFKNIYNSIAGDTWADSLFILGLLAVGASLVLGVFMNAAAIAGGTLMVLMWSAVLPPESNLFMDDHLIYALTLALLACLGAGSWLGLGHRWEQSSLVQKVPVLR